MYHKCGELAKNVEIYTPKELNHWVMVVTFDCNYFTHANHSKVKFCPYCGEKL